MIIGYMYKGGKCIYMYAQKYPQFNTLLHIYNNYDLMVHIIIQARNYTGA